MHLPFDPLDPRTHAAVTDYLFVADRIAPSDVAIVFGMTRWQRPLATALDLYRQQVVRRLVFTGGYNPSIDAVEAVRMAEAARAEGVPAEAIAIEPRATHTRENVTLSAEHLGDAQSVLLVAIHYHARRVQLTAEAILPGHLAIGLATYPSLFYDRADWHRSARGRQDVITELTKLHERHGSDFLNLSGSLASEAQPIGLA